MFGALPTFYFYNFLNSEVFMLLFEPPHDKTNKLACVHSEDSASAWASAQSDQSLCCPHEESLDP